VLSISVAGAVIIALIVWGVGRGIEYAVRMQRTQGTVEVLFIDGDGSPYRRRFVRPVGSEFTDDGMGDGKKRTFILIRSAMIPGERPLYLANPRSGQLYVPPSRVESEMSTDRLLKLSVTTPEVYHMAAAQRTEAPALNADKEDPNKWAWVKPVVLGFSATIIVIALVILVRSFR
jgi:hypothetical protein